MWFFDFRVLYHQLVVWEPSTKVIIPMEVMQKPQRNKAKKKKQRQEEQEVEVQHQFEPQLQPQTQQPQPMLQPQQTIQAQINEPAKVEEADTLPKGMRLA